MDLSKIPTGANPPYDVNAIIEIPQGGVPVKYEIDKDSGALIMRDEAGGDEKVLAVPVDKLHPFYTGVDSWRALPTILTEQIAHFFQHYKDLEKGKSVKITGWAEPEQTADLIRASIQRYKDAS